MVFNGDETIFVIIQGNFDHGQARPVLLFDGVSFLV